VAIYPGITPASPDIAYYNAVTHYPGIANNTTTVTNPVSVNDLIITPQGQFNTHPDDFIIAMKDPTALVNAGLPAVHNRYQTFQEAPGVIQHNTNISKAQTVNDLSITPQDQFSALPDDYGIAMQNPAAMVNAGLPAVHNRYQTFQEAPGVIQYNTNISNTQTVNDLSITPQDQFGALPDDYGIAMQNPAALVNAGLPAVNNLNQAFHGAPSIIQYNTNASSSKGLIVTPQGQFSALSDDYGIAMQDSTALVNAGLPVVYNRHQTFQETPGIVQHNTNTSNAQTINDLSMTPQGKFNTHSDDYIFAMQNPAALVNSEIRNEMRSVERVPPAIPPVIVEGEIELRSELTIDDKGYRLRQSVGKNTTPYKFAVGSAKNARLIQ
jgi:hypothetical protein